MLNFSHYIHFSRLLSNRTITKTQQELHLLPEMSIPWYLVLLLFKEERVTHTSGAAFARLLSLVFVRSFVISRNKLETNSHPILNKAHAWPGHRLYKGGFGSFWFRFRLEIWFTFHTAFRTSPVISSAMINTHYKWKTSTVYPEHSIFTNSPIYTHDFVHFFSIEEVRSSRKQLVAPHTHIKPHETKAKAWCIGEMSSPVHMRVYVWQWYKQRKNGGRFLCLKQNDEQMARLNMLWKCCRYD